MDGFVDETVIDVKAGDGGPGAVSFRREKYVPRGGPDGGDGGRGGDVVFVVRSNLKTLAHLKFKRRFFAENGHRGLGKRMSGKRGADSEIAVPPGTLIRDRETGAVLKDFLKEEDRWVFLSGGEGGQGNWHFRSARRQAPKFAQPGKPGGQKSLSVELKLIADVGLVGFPNAGKSTLLSRLTNANPRIGAYPFTTKIPNLGVLRFDDRDLIIADIPGIIEGASAGAGMGLQFLKHISRSLVIAYLVDLSDPSYQSAVTVLEGEVGRYSTELLTRPRIIVGNKLDVTDSKDHLRHLQGLYPQETVQGISAVSGEGLDDLGRTLLSLVL